MKPNDIPLERGKYYHIYNRGNNHEKLFYKKENYDYFLRKYDYYLSRWVDTYAFCLLPNHFHLLIKVKEEFAQEDVSVCPEVQTAKVPATPAKVPPFQKVEPYTKKKVQPFSSESLISEQFRKFFTSYAMAINKQQKRTGSLFQKNFKRTIIDDIGYLKNLVYYIHANPEKHSVVNDFRNYEWSSYNYIIKTTNMSAGLTELYDWFGGREYFVKFHDQNSGRACTG